MATRDEVSVRPAGDDDLDALNAGNPIWVSAELLRASVAASGDTPAGLWVGLVGGSPAGFAAANGSGVCDGFRGGGYLFVRPEFRRNGVGTALWTSVLGICTPERVRGVLLQIDADDTVSRDVALAHGLRAGHLHIESRLDLTSTALEDLALAPLGEVSLRPLSPDAGEDQWLRFADVFNRLSLDTPDQSGGAEAPPYEVLRSLLPEPWQVMGAWVDEQMVALTTVMVRDAERRTLNTILTGVEREYRGKGLSTALKASHAVALRDLGWRNIVTHNMDGNAPILASNRTLGFEYVRGVLDLLFDHPPAPDSPYSPQ